MNDLIPAGERKQLPTEYKHMLARIEESLPAIQRDSDNFYKSKSQYGMALLDATAISPMARVKNVLAEIDRTRGALREAYFKRAKADIERRRKQEQLQFGAATGYDRELLEVEIAEISSQLEDGANYIRGAIRKLSYFVTQYRAVLAKFGKSEVTEADYEAEEDRYHIMTAMRQALSAARSRNGIIDEGNQIYLFDLGINGMVAQAEVSQYLRSEVEMINRGEEPTYEMTMRWLEHCADKFAGQAHRNAEARGYVLFDDQSLNRKVA